MDAIATKSGLPGYGAVYVGAHYDTVGIAAGVLGGPGAIDNVLGVGVMLEGARVAAVVSYTPTLHFIVFGGGGLPRWLWRLRQWLGVCCERVGGGRDAQPGLRRLG